jgi:uncharacterized membrane protein YphA (DoxX/SURF4 family)
MAIQTEAPSEEQRAAGTATRRQRVGNAFRYRGHLHLPRALVIHGGRHPVSGRPAVNVRAATASTSTIALAGLQLLLGYEWVLSGVDKLLYGQFPQQVGALLAGQVNGGRLPSFFAGILRAVVLPNAGLFGVLIEWGETLAGLGLLAAGVSVLLRPVVERRLAGRLRHHALEAMRLSERLAPIAAAGAGLMGLSFFLLDGVPSPFPQPSIAYGGALDVGLFLALGSVVLLAAALTRRHAERMR